MKKTCSATVMCPFYHSEDAQKIYCDGVTDASSLHVVFGAPPKKEEYKCAFCKTKNYEKCLVADMLTRKAEGYIAGEN